MGLQMMTTPLIDFTVTGVYVPTPGLNSHGRSLVALVNYDWRGQSYQAHYEYHAPSSSLCISTQGQCVELPTSQLLGSLLARISTEAANAQTH